MTLSPVGSIGSSAMPMSMVREGKRFLGAIDRRIGLVARFDELLAALVFLGMRLGLLDHFLDIGLAQAAGRLDPDALLLSACLVLGRYVDDAVGIDIEGDLDLRDA